MVWVGNNLMEVLSLRDCYKYRAGSTKFACVGFDDDDERGVPGWEIPLCPGLGHI